MCGITGFIGDSAEHEEASRALDSKRNVIYTRPVWRIIMTIIRAISEAVFKRLDT